jgi:glycosyltransferase involved in cell wall biosynthesis
MKITLIIPNYNKELFVVDCIKSCINQTYKNIEIIFIDNESKDNSLQKVKDFKSLSGHDFIIDTAENIYPMCWDECIEKAQKYITGDYYTIIGSDDLIKEDYIENCVNFINQKKPLCFQSDLLWFSNNQILRQTNHRYSSLQNFKQQLLTRCCVNTPTVFYKRDFLEKFNLKPNPVEFSGANDYDLYCQIADSGILVENAENWLGYLYRENELQCTWQMHKQPIPYDYLIQSKWKSKWKI